MKRMILGTVKFLIASLLVSVLISLLLYHKDIKLGIKALKHNIATNIFPAFRLEEGMVVKFSKLRRSFLCTNRSALICTVAKGYSCSRSDCKPITNDDLDTLYIVYKVHNVNWRIRLSLFLLRLVVPEIKNVPFNIVEIYPYGSDPSVIKPKWTFSSWLCIVK